MIIKRKILKKIITIVIVTILSLMAIFPADILLQQVKLALIDSDIVDTLYWANKDTGIIDSLLDGDLVQKVNAADPPPNGFYIKTGVFLGNAAPKTISGLGFSPDLVILKPDTTAGAGAIFKTKAMSILNVSYFVATAQTSAGAIQLEEDGFTASTTTSNNANIPTTWTAFGGSNCTSTGVFCTGTYIGSGTATKSISTGFQPDLVWVKRSTAVSGTFRTSSMGTNVGQYFTATAQDTTGVLFTTLDSGGFTVGSTNNTSTGIFYYVAFKNVSGAINVGSYTGNATDNRNITGVGFTPDLVITKNSATTVAPVFNVKGSNGDHTSHFTDTAKFVNGIQALQSDGFQIGTDATVNSNSVVYYYAAFGGAAGPSSGSGTFKMATGSYTGNGGVQVIQGLDFEPNLVIIKANSAQTGVFRTSDMSGDLTAVLDGAASNIANGIISLNPDGFTVGSTSRTNAASTTYYWEAFGNAWRQDTNSGASDFFIGTYYGNGLDNRTITFLPFQADLLVIKGNTTTAGVFRTSDMSGDLTGFFAATAETTNNIQAISSNSFEVGSGTSVNSNNVITYYFGFKNGSNFKVGTYSGNGTSQTISAVGFQPDYIWVKQTGATRGIMRSNLGATDSAFPFINATSFTGGITGIVSNGFTVGSATETNASGTNNYRYIAWKNNYTPQSKSYQMKTGYYIGNGAYKQISGLGFSPDLVIIKSDSSTTGALFKTKSMPNGSTSYFMATADSTAGLVTLKSDGFMVSSTATSTNIRYTWVAYSGSDCTSTGIFCTNTYIGSGSSPRAITVVGFQSDLIVVKQNSTTNAVWRSSSMPNNYVQYLSATVQDTTGSYISTIDSTGFTIGSGMNSTSVYYHFFTFKNVTGSINVGTYTGNGTDNRNITGVGFKPNFVFLKNAETTSEGVMNLDESYGDYSSYFIATANVANSIQALISDGFQIGTHATANTNLNVHYYAAFGDAEANSAGTGSFTMATGSYTGNSEYKIFMGLSFTPDLIIIKGNTTQTGVFRTSSMGGDSTAILDGATANIASAIISINKDGFTVGNSATVNSNGVTYYWTAYGNAWRPETNNGATDFYVGAYYANGSDNTDITRLPFQADLLTIKRNSTTAGVYKTSDMSGDLTGYFAATAETTNSIQAFNTDGFEIGTTANVNTATNTYWYFGFKNGNNFKVGTYSGTGSAQTISAIGFQPDHVWVKATGATRGILRTKEGVTDSALPFINVGAITGGITALASNGITLGTASETNSSGTNNYRYVAWKTPSVTFSSSGTQSTNLNVNSTNNYIGAAFTAVSTSSSINITRIILSETGTIAANTNLANVKLYYETTGTCTYNGTETQFGTTQSFGASQTATFDGTITVGTSQICIYPVLDVGSGASAGETIELEITSSSNINISTGIISGTFPVTLSGTTTLIATSNTAPNSPASLAQKKVDDSTISTGAWINQTSVKFTANVSDTDNPDTLYLCVEVLPISSPFTGTETACGSSVSYVGSALAASVTIGSLTDNEYKWQARVKDSLGAYSAWVHFSSLPSSLIGYWKMDETSWTTDCSTASVIDSTSNANNGKSCPGTTGPTTTASGKYDRAGDFDGSEDYVDTGSGVNITNLSFTISGWVKRDVTNVYEMVVSQGTSSTNQGLHFGFVPGNVVRCGFFGNDLDSTTLITDTTGWHHIACAYNASTNTRYIYIDGVLDITQSGVSADYSGTGNLIIGSWGWNIGTSEKFNGKIDEVKIYNVARDLSGIIADMNGYSGTDFGIDTTAPTGGTVYDGSSNGVDIMFNDGSLSTLSANWSGVNASNAGLSSYDYSIGTSAGGTDVVNWTSNGTSTSITVNSLNLQSSKMYFFNVRTNDAAGNSATISSNGQVVAPSLTFTLSSNSINFSNLNAGNSYSDTKTTTLTTSTNAYNGYVIRLFKTDSLRSATSPSITIPDFNGGTYAAPSAWGSNTGFGYTSNDTTIQGVNKFNPVTCAGGGSSPCYAPISSSAPGDIVADHTSNVTGSPITNEQFIITYKVQTQSTQSAGTYSTSLVYTIIPQY